MMRKLFWFKVCFFVVMNIVFLFLNIMFEIWGFMALGLFFAVLIYVFLRKKGYQAVYSKEKINVVTFKILIPWLLITTFIMPNLDFISLTAQSYLLEWSSYMMIALCSFWPEIVDGIPKDIL